ncbi:MAG: bifunctional adenosylcobinamide kinase/adenosylcobinamide-phosphate guanylyltransferase [Eubacteriales bacterium]|nr:bifunctional adenosylcobinamide kinase/adenosylcobinamide-phosphate guanylyltransferase [Eubacteriales bacterium]
MIVIIGGQYQGRHAFAKSLMTEEYCLVDDAHEQVIAALLTQYGEELWELAEQELLRLIRERLDTLMKDLRQAVIILPECGSGVISIDRQETVKRRIIGCTGAYLASEAESCYRVFCGLGYRLDDNK